MALIDFTLSNARRFYSSMGNPLGVKGLTIILSFIEVEANGGGYLPSHEAWREIFTTITNTEVNNNIVHVLVNTTQLGNIVPIITLSVTIN